MLKQYWENRGHQYDKEWLLLEQLTTEHRSVLRTLLRQIKPEIVLEVGIGTGRVSNIVQGQRCGIDFSKSMLANAKQKGYGFLILADVQHLPFREDTFTCVLACEVFQHIADIDEVVRECSRVAKFVICLEHDEEEESETDSHCFQHDYRYHFGTLFDLLKEIPTRGRYRPETAFLFERKTITREPPKQPEGSILTKYEYFTSYGNRKGFRRTFVYYADNSKVAKVLSKEITEKAKRIADHEVGRNVIDLYSFGFRLDVGCGHHKMGEIGIDRERTESVDVLADARVLPFRDDVFDCVIAHHVLEHIPEVTQAVLELKRVAKSSVIIAVPRYEDSFVHPKHIHHFKQETLREGLSKVFEVERDFSVCNSYIFICHKWKEVKK